MQQWYSNRRMVFSVIGTVVIAMQWHGKHLCGIESGHNNRKAVFSVGLCQGVLGETRFRA
jgi:hypothetical protein